MADSFSNEKEYRGEKANIFYKRGNLSIVRYFVSFFVFVFERGPPFNDFKFVRRRFCYIKRSKRRKDKYNPYVISIEDNIYKVSFKDVKGKTQIVIITREIFDLLNTFELEDLSIMNEYDNHIEHSELMEHNLYVRAKEKPSSVENEVMKKISFEILKEAISMLPDIQRRRIKKYYFENKTEQQIADEEGTTHQAVHIVLERAKKNLREILKNLN